MKPHSVNNPPNVKCETTLLRTVSDLVISDRKEISMIACSPPKFSHLRTLITMICHYLSPHLIWNKTPWCSHKNNSSNFATRWSESANPSVNCRKYRNPQLNFHNTVNQNLPNVGDNVCKVLSNLGRTPVRNEAPQNSKNQNFNFRVTLTVFKISSR